VGRVSLGQVYGVDFSPNGYHLATGSDDHTCRVWDLRKKQCLYIIPAHNSLISQVKYEPSEGYFLVTASFDNTARVCLLNPFLYCDSCARLFMFLGNLTS
jgi:WD40 repeat protein